MASTKRGIIGAIAAVALLGVTTYALKKPIFCSRLVNPYAKTAAFIVIVPASETAKFDQDITKFMKLYSLSVVKGSSSTSEPLGQRAPYVGHQVVGCDGTSFVWSGNEVMPRAYIVTFHRNRLLGDQTPGLRDHFLSEFRQRYDVRPYVDWRS